MDIRGNAIRLLPTLRWCSTSSSSARLDGRFEHLDIVLNVRTIVLDMRTDENGISNVLFGHTRGGILGLLYSHPDRSFYVRQIARQIDVSVGSVQRELETLSGIGLIARSSVGNQVFYQANKESPLFSDIRALVAKTIGVFHILRSALMPLDDQIQLAFVYGSLARNEENAGSDVDLMVVGKVKLEDVLERLTDVEKSLGRPVNPTVYSVAEFKSKLASGNHFLNAVVRGQKVFLTGAEDELRKMGGVRVGQARTQ